MQRMGVALDLGPVGAARCIDEAGVTFMFAPRFHPAMKRVVPVRRALGVRTAFNVLGPMLNPAGAKYGLVGVYSTGLARLMAEALQVRRLGCLSGVFLFGFKFCCVVFPLFLFTRCGSARASWWTDCSSSCAFSILVQFVCSVWLLALCTWPRCVRTQRAGACTLQMLRVRLGGWRSV